MSDEVRWAAGAALAVAVATGARAAGALAWSGAVAAAVLGTAAVAAGWQWGVLLVAYFVASTLLSRIGRAEREQRTRGRVEKAGARDAAQVAANGGVFGLTALGFIVAPGAGWLVAGASSLAASAADTWATEIGTLSRTRARSILTGRAVAAGTSGGVTVQGLLAGVAGAAFVGAVATTLGWPGDAVNAAVAGGILGMLLDSILGASVQARRWCEACAMDTEQRVHRCGAATVRRAGVAWIDNDAVNALSTIGGAFAGVVLWRT